jgi:hypothetical protein
MKFVFWLALTLTLSPNEREQPLSVSGFANTRPANPVARISVRRRLILSFSPSPIGWERVAEGRVRD